MDTLKNINEILYTIYLISAGPIFLFIAYKGLEQIKAAKENSKIAKEISKTQSTREAFKLAGEQCVYFAEKTIPLYTNFMSELKDNDCKFFERFELKVVNKSVSVKLKDEIPDQDFECLQNSKYLQDLINSIEGFSLYFVSGVASEKVGYMTVGRGYCEMVSKLMPFFVIEFKKGYFKNTSKLFITWHNKCKQDDLKIKQKELEKELQNTSEMKIPTIGSD